MKALVIYPEGAVLLVRHSYGKFERLDTARQAVLKSLRHRKRPSHELQEELNVPLENITLFGIYPAARGNRILYFSSAHGALQGCGFPAGKFWKPNSWAAYPSPNRVAGDSTTLGEIA